MTNTITIMHVNLAKGFRGGERQTELLIIALARYFNVTQIVACRDDSPLRDRLKDIERVSFLATNHQLHGHFLAPKVDVIHAHEAKAVHWAYIHKLLRKTPYILTRRVDTPIKSKWSNQISYKNAFARVGISSIIANHLIEKNWGNVKKIPSVLSHLPPPPKSNQHFHEKNMGKIIIGHVGALVDRHKGQKILIESAKKLFKSHPHLHFCFFGDGEDRDELQALSNSCENVSWMGFKPNIGDYIPFFDIFAFPSRNEGLGSTLLDVMDAGVPIIASDVGGIPDIIIHRKTGILVPPNDSAALTNAIKALIEDPELREELIKNSKNKIQEFTPKKMAESYFSLYKESII